MFEQIATRYPFKHVNNILSNKLAICTNKWLICLHKLANCSFLNKLAICYVHVVKRYFLHVFGSVISYEIQW